MKLIFKTIVTVCLVFLFSNQVTAQVYPVQLNPIYNIPYSSKISDYATSMDEKVRLIVNPTDITINNRQVRLKLYIQGNGINAQSNNYVQGLNPIYINGGELITLTNLDFAALFQLQNLEGLSAVQYANPLPDGLYTVCFEMYDFITNQRLSQKSCTNLYFQLNDPPLLNIPTKNEQIPVTDFPNILFTWTPRQINATNVSYQFELREILDPTMDPQFAFPVSPLLLEEDLFATALLYDLSKPTLLAGKTYAWRVKAISTSGLSENNVFKNNGYSEIFWFKYLANCPPPAYLLSEAQSTSRVKLTWQGNPENKKYHVQYKKNNVANAEWFSIYTLNTQATISDLEPGVTYDFRVGATCETLSNTDLSYVYSGINEFTMPEEDVTTNSNYNCGINPSFSITNQTPITNLIINETFTAGDFPVKILEINGNGTYTGKGYIIVPYLADTKLAVEFENVTINTDYQLVSGIVETTYNPNWTNISDLEDLTDNGDISIKEIPFEITDITIDSAGDIVVNGPNGEQITIPGGGNVQIVDPKGNVYTVDPEGNIQGPFQQAAGGAPTPENTDGVNQNGQATSITADGVLITFQKAANNVYGFDGVVANAPSKLKDLYTKLGSDYYMPYKSILNSAQGGVDDYIIANVEITDTNIIADSIVFKTQKGIKIESEKINDKEYKLILKGSFKNTEGDILASIKQGDKYKIAGAFKLLYLAKRTTAKVILVNTDDATIPNKATLQNYLNETYKGAGASFEVIETITININDKLSDVTKIDSGESGFAANYTTEQQAINSAIIATATYNQNKDAYYLIITNKASSENQEGFMPLGRQFGYIFSKSSETNKTIAHELGHGVFQLKHPFSTLSYNFSKGFTNWLMDYATATELPYAHWKQIQSPDWRIGIFDSDSEGEVAGGFAITPNFRFISNGENRQVAFLESVSNGFLGGFVKNSKSYKWSETEKKYINDSDNSDFITSSSIEPDLNSKIWLFFDNKSEVLSQKVLRTIYNQELKNVIKSSDSITLLNFINKYATKENYKKKGENRDTYWTYIHCLNCDSDGNEIFFATPEEEAEAIAFWEFFKNCYQEYKTQEEGYVPRCLWDHDAYIPNGIFGYYINDPAFTSGIIDGLIETGDGLLDIALFADCYNPISFRAWTTDCSVTRTKTYQALKQMYELMSDSAKLDAAYDAIGTSLGGYIDETTSFDNQARYNHGKIVFNVASLFIGVDEAKALINGEKALLAVIKEGLSAYARIPATILKLTQKAGRNGVAYIALKTGNKSAYLGYKLANVEIILADVTTQQVLININWATKNGVVLETIEDIKYLDELGFEKTTDLKIVLQEDGKLGIKPGPVGSALVNSLSPELRVLHNRLVDGGVQIFEQGNVIKYVTTNANEFAKIESGIFSLTYAKGSRPLPSTYLKAEYITGYLSKFEQEGFATRIVLKDAYNKYGIGKPDIGKTEFVSLKSDIDKLIIDSKGDLDILSLTLGVPKEQLAGGLVRVDFKITSTNKIHMPTGNEFGANAQWLPGGKLPTGQLEAVVKTDGMVKNIDYTVIDITW